MRKIGIMSMERIFNYGSFLQAYSLKNMIKSLNYDTCFVDYHPGKILVKTNETNSLLRKVMKVNETIKVHTSLQNKLKYINYKKNYAANYYPLLGLKSEKNYLTNDLKTLVIGSDEVFNCVQSNVNVGFSKDLFGANSKADRLISYAASFGNTTIEKLNKYKISDQIAKWLNEFDSLSVRDENSKKIVQKLTNKKVVENLDPVLIYFNPEILSNILLKYEVPRQKYLLLYGYSGRFSLSECRKIKKFAQENNLKILCIGGIQHCCDEFIDCSPFEVLSYFNNAEYVITDTFHGTIMSIINHRPFVTIIREEGYGNSQKLQDLLNKLGLSNRKITDLNNLADYFKNLINYENIEVILNEERKKAIDYLSKEL